MSGFHSGHESRSSLAFREVMSSCPVCDLVVVQKNAIRLNHSANSRRTSSRRSSEDMIRDRMFAFRLRILLPPPPSSPATPHRPADARSQRRSGRFRWQAAVPDQFHGLRERHDIIGLGMEDDRARFHRRGRSPSFPRRTEKNKRRRTRVDVHRDGSTPAGTDHDIGPMPVELRLGESNGGVEIVVGQGGIEDFVAVMGEIGRFTPPGVEPAVKEEDSDDPPIGGDLG